MKSKFTFFLIVVLIIIPLTVLGCKTQDTTELEEKIAEPEGKLAEEETEVVEEEMPEVIEEGTQEEAQEEAPVDEEETESDTEEEAEGDADKEAPTISLAIYEGPTLEGSICYYRIEAMVTGNPTVSFSKDDSGGAWGSKKVQINLNDPADTYTLTATATNSEGSATDSITLSWGCSIPEPEPDPIEADIDIDADIGISGYIIVNVNAYPGPAGIVGDHINNELIKSYLSFDIDDLGAIEDLTIKDVSVTIPVSQIVNNPELASPTINIKVYDYGNSLDYPADQGTGGELVKTLPTSDSLTNMNFSSAKLEDELQKAVDIDKKWFQLKIALGGVSLANKYIELEGLGDYYNIEISNVVLHVQYEVPG